MTGYHITLGYISGESYTGRYPWLHLKELAFKVCHDTDRLYDQTIAYGYVLNPEVAYTCAQHYGELDDATISFIESDEAHGPQIMILASGDGTSRAAKEHVARAFVRLLMAEAHRAGLEISVVVA